MPKTILNLLLGLVLLIAAACAPGVAPPDQNTVNTAIAQTITALTLTAGPGIPVTGPETATPSPTFSPSPEPPSPTPSETPTPIIIIIPPTPDVPQIRVSVPTNCRVGPGRAFTRVGYLAVGEVAEVVARSSFGNYWIIRDPNQPNVTCWLWGEYATVTGNISLLPVYTPPPSPTPRPTSTPTQTPTPTRTPVPIPSFGALYSGLESCAGTGWWADIELSNASGVDFESISLTVRDTIDNTVISQTAESFINRNGCNEIDTRDALRSGTSLIVSSPIFDYDPRGRALRATITLCSRPGLDGRCATEVTSFTP